ncbi:MAG TPA: hypothetical protein VKA97_00930 [Pyrinomonadaceae bacterium]|nr:hypothetical protein [Pyrinomonadaceae bacterium]
MTKDATTSLYLFPDEPATLELFKELKAGHLKGRVSEFMLD